jgi:hypothetical protein
MQQTPTARPCLEVRPGRARLTQHPHNAQRARACKSQDEENDEAQEKTIHGRVSFHSAIQWRYQDTAIEERGHVIFGRNVRGK